MSEEADKEGDEQPSETEDSQFGPTTMTGPDRKFKGPNGGGGTDGNGSESGSGSDDGSTGGENPIGGSIEIPIEDGELTAPKPPYDNPSSTVPNFEKLAALDDDWIDVLNFSPPPSVRRAVSRHDGKVQPVTDAQTPLVNVDRYRVHLSDFENHRTKSEIFDYVRRDFGELLDPSDGTFADYGELESGVLSDWKEGGPHEAVQVFELKSFSASMLDAFAKWMSLSSPFTLSDTSLADNANEAAVAGTKTDEFEWTFSTLTTPEYGAHPVSGNRRFRLETSGDEYVFVIEAVDRMYSGWLDTLSSLDPEVDVPFTDWFPDLITETYEAGHDTWVSFCENLVESVEENGGSAYVDSTFSNRFDWEPMKEDYYRN